MKVDLFAPAKRIADAVLYEGYVLYPYRASARKNQLRWQFGVVAPREFADGDTSEDWAMQTECLLRVAPDAVVDVRVRFLRVQERQVERSVGAAGFEPVASLEVGSSLLTTWDEAVEAEIDVPGLDVAGLLTADYVVPISLAGAQIVEPVVDDSGRTAARVVRRCHPLTGAVRVVARTVRGPEPLVRLQVRVENETPWSTWPARREDVVRRSFNAVHTLLAAHDGRFLSLADPPPWARRAAADCVNLHTWPVLVDGDDGCEVVLSSPVTLSDHPSVAPESPGDMFDATEIDEILALRVLTLTEEEKREARSTDARAAAIVDRCDVLPEEIWDRLHGAVRYLRDVPAAAPSGPSAYWDPDAEADVDPFADRVWVGAVPVGNGTRVRLRPARRADAHDLFLTGREALVKGVFQDFDGNTQVAVSVLDDDDTELHLGHGRYLFFYPDEVEPSDATP